MSFQGELRHLNNMLLHILCVYVWVHKQVLGLPKCTWRPVQEKDLTTYSLMAGSMASSVGLVRGPGEVCRHQAELFPWHWPEFEDNLVHRSQSVPWNITREVSFFPGGLLQTFEMPVWIVNVQGRKVWILYSTNLLESDNFWGRMYI